MPLFLFYYLFQQSGYIIAAKRLDGTTKDKFIKKKQKNEDAREEQNNKLKTLNSPIF